MNTIELDIIKSEGEYILKLLIDSKEFLETEAIVLDELVESLDGNGEYLIFTCTCGVADCAGWDKIHVEFKENTVKWNFDYDEIKYEFKFKPMNYKGEIERVLNEINEKKIELSPKYIIYPE